MQNEAIRDELLKVDRRGRVRVSPERREALLNEFERWGVMVAAAIELGSGERVFSEKNGRRAGLFVRKV